MKSPLRYQATCYDCGTTALVDALMAVFEREQIPPEVVRFLTAMTCDKCVGTTRELRGGTSAAAMAFAAAWLNDCAGKLGFPVACEQLRGDDVTLRAGGRLDAELRAGAAVVAGVCLGADHYVVLTGVEKGAPTGVPAGAGAGGRADGALDGGRAASGDGALGDGCADLVRVFDPYYDTWPLHDLPRPAVGVRMVDDQPFSHNRLVERWVFEEPAGTPYALDQKTGREALIVRRVG